MNYIIVDDYIYNLSRVLYFEFKPAIDRIQVKISVEKCNYFQIHYISGEKYKNLLEELENHKEFVCIGDLYFNKHLFSRMTTMVYEDKSMTLQVNWYDVGYTEEFKLNEHNISNLDEIYKLIVKGE